MSNDDISFLLKLGRDEKHHEVIEQFLMLDNDGKSNEMAMMAYADSLYELGDDPSSLEAYLAIVMQHPKGIAVNFALFDAAMALKNMDLQGEALDLLRLINPGHEGVEKEIEASNYILDQQSRALAVLANFNKSAASLNE